MGSTTGTEPLSIEQAVEAALAHGDTHDDARSVGFMAEGGCLVGVSAQAQPVLIIERRGGPEVLPTREQVDAVRAALAAHGRTVLDEWIGYAYGLPTSVSIRIEPKRN